MRVSVLETGKLPENLEKKFGDYPKMFSDLFDELNVPYEIKSFDLINDEFPKNLDNTDLWLITGSSFGVYDKIAWIDKLKNLVQKIYNIKTPLVGICFGHQVIADALGGKVEKSHKGWGVGVHKYERKLNPEWSEIVGDFFSGYVSHQDQVIVKPENAYTIYGSDFCPNSILCYDDIEKPVVISIQSHPEFKKDCLEMIIQRRLGQTISTNVGIKGLESLKENIDNQKIFKPLLRALRVI
mgnify:FL=1